VLTDRMRELFKNIINPVAAFLLKLGLTPDMVTLAGFLGHIAAAFLAASGKFTWAGLVILLTAPFDALDGAMARQRGNNSKFGAFFDSVIDRYSEFALYGGLMVYYGARQDIGGILLVYLSVAGSIMVSYSRARAETLGFSARLGLLSRVERYLVLIPCLLFQFPRIGLWILAIFTNITSIQRIISVKKQSSPLGSDPVPLEKT
jgi:CDP-diacylglycerol--glycerol-3-phosphate 3-phosphatidyltransferase